MFAKIIYFPFLLAVIVVGLFALRSALGGRLGSAGTKRMTSLALLAGGLAAGSLYLMFGIDETWSHWAAVGLLAVAVLPLFTPVLFIILGMLIAKASGKPIRWN